MFIFIQSILKEQTPKRNQELIAVPDWYKKLTL